MKEWKASGRTTVLPWKTHKQSRLISIPGASDPKRIRDDLAHVFAIGFGKELCGSCIIALAGMGVFDGRSIGARLGEAYILFRAWCVSNKETTKISEFSLKTFKVQTYHGLIFKTYMFL